MCADKERYRHSTCVEHQARLRKRIALLIRTDKTKAVLNFIVQNRFLMSKNIQFYAAVTPSPMPSPSTADNNGLFFDANASARAKITQLTTINGINRPNFA